MNGQIHLIYGNHDAKIKNKGFFTSEHDYYEMKYKDKFICMFHYPIYNWNRSHYGSIHLHGHCHGTIDSIIPNRFDVGVDCFDYTPVPLDYFIDKKNN